MNHDPIEAIRRLLPHAEKEQESLYEMQKKNPDEYEVGYLDSRNAVSYAYEAIREHDDQHHIAANSAKLTKGG